VVDVLIVDDSAAIRQILGRVLRQAEIPIGSVYEACDGVEALEMLKKQKVGLILSDISMPNMDGLEFLTKVRAEQAWRNLPIVMVSTEGTHAKVLEAVKRGASGYVRKPFTAEQIKESLAGLF
jgi:two-component system chemotaxis response regulator CheY